MTAVEYANAHDSGDCLSTCQHPDHAFDERPVDLHWLITRLSLDDPEDYDLVVQLARAEHQRPVIL